MNVRWVTALLVGLLVVVHGQMWFGRGSLTQVQELRNELATQKQANELSRQQNEQLANEVRDLREGLEMVEEKARSELGMVKPNEIFVQIQRKPNTP
jgi:cell division protein FtsB